VRPGTCAAAASNPGSGGTYWQTTVWAYQDRSAEANLTLCAGNEELPAPDAGVLMVTVHRGQVVRLDDVLSTFGDLTPPAALFYAWEGIDAGDGAVTSRTYTVAADVAGGTLGQGIPGIDVGSLPAASVSQVVPLSPDESSIRSNVGVANAGTAAAEVLVRLRSEGGAVLGEYVFSLPAGGWRQLGRVFDVVGTTPQPRSYAEVLALDSGGGQALLAVYASLVDNTSGDPTLLAGQWVRTAGEGIMIPVAAHNAGQAGTQWVTDISAIRWGDGGGSGWVPGPR